MGCDDARNADGAFGIDVADQFAVDIAHAHVDHRGTRLDPVRLDEAGNADGRYENVGLLTEFLKIAALCETHYVGLVPHFTGPIAEAALVHACSTFSGPVMMEMTGDGTQEIPYLPQGYDFRSGKLWPNKRAGLGVEVDTGKLELMAEVTEPSRPIPLYRRADGSITNW